MGKQGWAETSATLRNNIETTLEKILEKNKKWENLPAPFIQDGYWADYDDIKKSFNDQWKRFEKAKRPFFRELWESRSLSGIRTFLWLLKQLPLLILNPRVLKDGSIITFFMYLTLLFIGPILFLMIYLLFPSIMSSVLNDVRLYCAPKGMVERAIVQRIDYRVGQSFLKLIGLNWEFRKLDNDNKYKVDSESVEFKRVYWVAHSLGSVISYNVLSDMFNKADYLTINGDDEQKEGVDRFWDSLQRFITIGSPLDKIAVLFGGNVIRPWPKRMYIEDNEDMRKHGNDLKSFRNNWWLNYYHFLDPVSGALSNKMICPIKQMPNNYHLKNIFRFPGLAHVAYWKDKTFLGYLLSRFFGRVRLEHKRRKSFPRIVIAFLGFSSHLLWLALILGAIYGIYNLIS